jgi:uncharacterized protein
MEFEWDEEKRLRNIEKHDFDFARVDILFDGRPNVEYRSKYEFEERWLTIGLIDDVFYTIVWTPRGKSKRIISARRARDAEERHYRAVHG